MVGTAVYQVGFDSSIAAKNFSALNPGVQNTEPPRDSGASSPAISPWMWNSGMMLRPRSAAVKARLVAMSAAAVQRAAKEQPVSPPQRIPRLQRSVDGRHGGFEDVIET